MLVLIVSVISASIVSVKVQAGRSRVANSVDQAMFSLFAQYDRDLLSKYDVFFIDGAVGSGNMQIGSIYDRFTGAMGYILEPNKGNVFGGKNLLFVDGWIGKGAILNTLQKELANYPEISSDIAVVADPANVTELCGTHEDILIPSSCLNSTVSGLVSRTFLRDDIIKKDDYHGAVYYGELEYSDLSYEFIDAIVREFEYNAPKTAAENNPGTKGIDEVNDIAKHFGIDDINLIKPGIGEATRVLLRRVPWKVLIDEKYKDADELAHVVRLAEEKNVPIEYYPLTHYKTCGIIRKLADT